jgi:hypothetical protein
MAIVLPIVNFIPCSNKDICVFDSEGNGYVERMSVVVE